MIVQTVKTFEFYSSHFTIYADKHLEATYVRHRSIRDNTYRFILNIILNLKRITCNIIYCAHMAFSYKIDLHS